MSRYRILRLITWLPTGGIERKIAAVLPKLNREVFEAHVCCLRERGPLASQLEAEGIPVHLCPFSSRWDPGALWRLHRLIKKLDVDLVHCHMYRANVPGTVMKILNSGLVVIGHYHNVDTWESAGQLFVDRLLAPKRDLNLAVSQAVRANVIQTLGLPEHKSRTLYNCVDLTEFHPVSTVERHATRERLGLPAAARVVLMVARLVPQKNQALVVQSIPELLESSPRSHFVFAGGGPDLATLKELVARLNVGANVTFLGSRDDVPRILPACDVFVLPSMKEGFSNAVLEAMACGLPVVASNVGGNREVIDHGVNGFLADIETVQAQGRKTVHVNTAQFVRYLKRLLVDEDFRSRIAVAALRQAQSFSLESMVAQTEQLYLELLER